MNIAAKYSYRNSFNLAVERSIATGYIDRDLMRCCRATGENYNDVVEHIANEIRLNK